jgi:ferrochelatase
MKAEKIGVLVMSYGTPESFAAVADYYTHIRRGRPPAREQLDDLIRRYEAIGGLFPLRENTNRQVQALQETLNRQSEAHEFVCYQGLKHAPPFIEDGVEAMAGDGIQEAVGIVLAPHYSVMSVGGYIQRAEAAAKRRGLRMRFVKSYHLHPKLIAALAERVSESIGQFPVQDRDEVEVIFSAHSLPEKILALNDPYPRQLRETAEMVAEKAAVKRWRLAWQSAGQTPEPWLGPDILEVLRSMKEERVSHVLVCPAGFVSDHLEVLYDIDIECRNLAERLGMNFRRTRSLGTDPKYMETLADMVIGCLDSSAS